MKNQSFDVITIGSANVDVFVRTQNEEISQHGDHHDVCYTIGSKFLIKELHFSTGGGATNSAVAFSRLGLKTGTICLVGEDANGTTVLDELKKEKITFLGKRKNGMTGYSVILIGLDKDRSILTYKGINNDLKTSDLRPQASNLKPKWFYISSMMNSSFETAKEIVKYAKKNKIKWAFNPSQYLAEKGIKALKEFIDGCDLLVLNKEEAEALVGSWVVGVWSIDNLLEILKKHAKIVVITDGPRNVHASDGVQKYSLYPTKIKIVETTGAGDAFASGVLAGIQLKNDLEFALRLGYAESESVIQYIGAKNKLLTLNEALKLIKKNKVRIDVVNL